MLKIRTPFIPSILLLISLLSCESRVTWTLSDPSGCDPRRFLGSWELIGGLDTISVNLRSLDVDRNSIMILDGFTGNELNTMLFSPETKKVLVEGSFIAPSSYQVSKLDTWIENDIWGGEIHIENDSLSYKFLR